MRDDVFCTSSRETVLSGNKAQIARNRVDALWGKQKVCVCWGGPTSKRSTLIYNSKHSRH